MKPFLIIIILVSAIAGYSQQQVWDITFTELQIAQSKHHYSDNTDARNNQFLSQATVEAWKNQQTTFRDYVNSIDQWINKGFIVLTDAATAYEIYKKLQDMISLQGKSFDLIYKYPWAIPVFVDREKAIVTEAEEFVGFIYMFVVLGGQVNKMRVPERRLLYQELRNQLQLMVNHSKSLYYRIKAIDYQESLKSTKPIQWVNKDAHLVKDVIKDFKF